MHIGVRVASSRTAKCRRIKDGRLVLAVHAENAKLLTEGVIDTDITLIVINRTARKRREVVRIGSSSVQRSTVRGTGQRRQNSPGERGLIANRDNAVSVDLSGDRVLQRNRR